MATVSELITEAIQTCKREGLHVRQAWVNNVVDPRTGADIPESITVACEEGWESFKLVEEAHG